MKPYGLSGKVEIAPCGCCVKHPNHEGLLPWRSKSVKDACNKKFKHKARQFGKNQCVDDYE